MDNQWCIVEKQQASDERTVFQHCADHWSTLILYEATHARTIMGCKPGKVTVVAPISTDQAQQEKANGEVSNVDTNSTAELAAQIQTEFTSERSPVGSKKPVRDPEEKPMSSWTLLNDTGATAPVSTRSASAHSTRSRARHDHHSATRLGRSDKRTSNHQIFSRSKSTSAKIPLLSREATSPESPESSNEDGSINDDDEDLLNATQQSHDPDLRPDDASSSSSSSSSADTEKTVRRQDTLVRYFSSTPHHFNGGRNSRMDDLSLQSDESFPILNSISTSNSSMRNDEPSFTGEIDARSIHSDAYEPRPRPTTTRRITAEESTVVAVGPKDGRRSLSNELERRKAPRITNVKFISSSINKSDSTQQANENELLVTTY